MKHELIKTNEYLLIVDDSEIKIGDLYLNQTGNVFEKFTYRIPSSGHWCKKIIAHLPLHIATVLEGVDLLPPLEDNIVKAALQQPKMPVGFESEWNTKQIPDFHQAQPKTTTNSQGQSVWVGKYIFKD